MNPAKAAKRDTVGAYRPHRMPRSILAFSFIAKVF